MAAPALLICARRVESLHSARLSFSPSILSSQSKSHRAIGNRSLQTEATPPLVPEFGVVFDIDGVLLRGKSPLRGTSLSLTHLHQHRIPHAFLTNGGGKPEQERVDELSKRFSVPLSTDMFIQSHTPFADMDELKNKTVLVVGGEGDRCRQVAEQYGYKTVVTTADILACCPRIWPFSQHLLPYYNQFKRALPLPFGSEAEEPLKIDAIHVYNDPRDWGLDIQIIKDLLLSHNGHLATLSPKNGDASLPNKGYQQDGQPPLIFSNPDLLWAGDFELPRLGQGGFREAFEGVWSALTGGEKNGVQLIKTVMGKPHQPTFEFAEKRLIAHRKQLFKQFDGRLAPLKRVYMVGDNPESDILGANSYRSPHGTDWTSILVQTGVYEEGTVPAHPPRQIVGDAWDAVEWICKQEGCPVD